MNKNVCFRNLLWAWLFVAWCVRAVWAVEPVNPEASPAVKEVLQYLQSVYGRKTLAGYNVYVHTPDDYQQTARHGAVWGRDIRWLRDVNELAADAKRRGYLLTLHWHWFFDGDSAWTRRRRKPVDVGRVVTPGTPEHTTALRELAAVADKLQVLRDAGVPVLWRPLHEIDGGWFWWTDRKQPENTARLWRMMFDYFTHQRKLNNLIWVYSAGVGSRERKPVEYRKRFYPGSQYVDIAGVDIYGVDVQNEVDAYRDYFDVLSQVAPGKMLACCECDAIPNPERMQRGQTPRWLYAMPWWGCPSRQRSVAWARKTMSHPFVVTLDELPAFSWARTAPHVGLLSPRDDGSAWFPDGRVTAEAYAVDRDGKVERVDFLIDGKPVGSVSSPPYRFTWQNAPAGCYDLTAVAVDDEGQKTLSNRVRIVVGFVNAAKGKRVFASAGEHPERAVDGDAYTFWSPGRKADEEWIVVDLGRPTTIDRVNLLWGWKIHATKFTVDVATEDPQDPQSWRTVYRAEGLPWVTWKATHRVRFEPVEARYVRLSGKSRPRGQTWGAYQLAEFEIPVPAGR